MRELTKEEKNLSEKSVKRLETELAYNSYLTKYTKLMLDEGLVLNFRKQVKEYEDKMKELIAERDTAQKTITTLKDQLRNGVTEKDAGAKQQ